MNKIEECSRLKIVVLIEPRVLQHYQKALTFHTNISCTSPEALRCMVRSTIIITEQSDRKRIF